MIQLENRRFNADRNAEKSLKQNQRLIGVQISVVSAVIVSAV